LSFPFPGEQTKAPCVEFIATRNKISRKHKTKIDLKCKGWSLDDACVVKF
jgi:hypothetical protein